MALGNAVNLLRYLWEISRELPGNWKQKKKTLSRIKHSIQDYLSDGEELHYSQIKKRFGEPRQIALSYVESMETDELTKGLQISKKIVGIITVAVILAIVIWGGCVAMAYIDHCNNQNGYATVEVIELERTIIDAGG